MRAHHRQGLSHGRQDSAVTHISAKIPGPATKFLSPCSPPRHSSLSLSRCLWFKTGGRLEAKSARASERGRERVLRAGKVRPRAAGETGRRGPGTEGLGHPSSPRRRSRCPLFTLPLTVHSHRQSGISDSSGSCSLGPGSTRLPTAAPAVPARWTPTIPASGSNAAWTRSPGLPRK